MSTTLTIILSMLIGLVLIALIILMCYKLGTFFKSEYDDKGLIFLKGFLAIIVSAMILVMGYASGNAILTHYLL